MITNTYKTRFTAARKEICTIIQQEHKDLADRLSKLHGNVTIVPESSGIHLHLACPGCLEEDGESEFKKKHLTVNVSNGGDKACCCHKRQGEPGHVFKLSELLAYKTLEERGIQRKPHMRTGRVSTGAAADPKNFEADEHGNLVPIRPGECVPVSKLPAGHPAREYLEQRGFIDLDSLVDRFRLSFCISSNDKAPGYYLPFEFHSSCVGKLVFFIEDHGIYRGWQSRLVERVDGDKRLVLAPDGEFKHVATREPDGKWGNLVDQSRLSNLRDEEACTWNMPKYSCSPGIAKSECLMGFDACVRWNDARAEAGLPKIVVLVEGALDAAALGPMAMPIMGASISFDQANMVREIIRPNIKTKHPDRIIYVADNDSAGQDAAHHVRYILSQGQPLKVHVTNPPDGYKDVGELGCQDGEQWIKQQIAFYLAYP